MLMTYVVAMTQPAINENENCQLAELKKTERREIIVVTILGFGMA